MNTVLRSAFALSLAGAALAASGQNLVQTPPPEPATFAAPGLGPVALFKRRKRA